MKRVILTTGLLISGYACMQAVTLHSSAGQLGELLSATAVSDGVLTLTGEADARDLLELARSNKGIQKLDLTELEIVGLNATRPVIYGQRMFAADALPAYVFQGTSYREVKLPRTLKSVGEGAFYMSAIESMTWPSELEIIGDFAFSRCYSLKSVAPLPGSLRRLGQEAFAYDVLCEEMDLSATQLTLLPAGVFRDTNNLKTISLPASVTAIGENAFYGSGVSTIVFPGTMAAAPFALAGAHGLESVTLSLSNASQAAGLYYNDPRLRSVTPLGPEVPEGAFAYAHNIATDDALADVQTAGHYAMAGNNSSVMVLPASLQRIGRGVFASSPNLEIIDVRALEGRIIEPADDSFEGITPSDIYLLTLEENYLTWKNHPQWGQFNVIFNKTGVDESTAMTCFIDYKDGAVEVSSDTLIERISIYSIDGALLATAQPHSLTARVAVNASSGVIVVSIVTYAGEKSVKLMVP